MNAQAAVIVLLLGIGFFTIGFLVGRDYGKTIGFSDGYEKGRKQR